MGWGARRCSGGGERRTGRGGDGQKGKECRMIPSSCLSFRMSFRRFLWAGESRIGGYTTWGTFFFVYRSHKLLAYTLPLFSSFYSSFPTP